MKRNILAMLHYDTYISNIVLHLLMKTKIIFMIGTLGLLLTAGVLATLNSQQVFAKSGGGAGGGMGGTGGIGPGGTSSAGAQGGSDQYFPNDHNDNYGPNGIGGHNGYYGHNGIGGQWMSHPWNWWYGHGHWGGWYNGHPGWWWHPWHGHPWNWWYGNHWRGWLPGWGPFPRPY